MIHNVMILADRMDVVALHDGDELSVFATTSQRIRSHKREHGRYCKKSKYDLSENSFQSEFLRRDSVQLFRTSATVLRSSPSDTDGTKAKR